MFVRARGKKYKIKHIKAINGLRLKITRKKLVDIAEIEGLIEHNNLKSLILDDNKIKEIKGLENFHNLEVLSLQNNQISKITGLDNLRNLKELNLQNNQITEITGLDNLRDLRTLNLWDNKVTELKGLENLKDLKTLLILGNPLYNWFLRELGLYHNASVAVRYCQKLTGQYHFDLKNVNEFIKMEKEKINSFSKKEDFYSIMKSIANLYDKVRLDDLTLLYDFFGLFLKDYPLLYVGKFHEYYVNHIKGYLTLSQIEEFESYLIENYCSLPNEKLLKSFEGSLFRNAAVYQDIIVKGKIYITNLRLIIRGKVHVINRDLTRRTNATTNIEKKFKNQFISGQLNLGKTFGVPVFGFQILLRDILSMGYKINVFRLKGELDSSGIERAKAIRAFIARKIEEAFLK